MSVEHERRLTTSDGVELVYGDYGPKTGEPVVLCHGLAAGGVQFTADAMEFANLGYRVLVPDLRGHGRSATPDPAAPRNYTIERMALDLLEVLDNAGTAEVHYVGNSLGGILGLHLLKDHGRRFATLSTFGTSVALNLPGFTASLVPLSYRLTGPALAAKVTAWATTPSPEGRKIVEALIAKFDPQVGRAVVDAVSRYDLSANVAHYSGPYLLIRGAKDRQVNAALKLYLPDLRALPNFTLVDLPNAGHCANLDAPAAFRTTLLDFWRRHPMRG
ncbi:alpha/beta fold hydrolase [Pelagibacterium luteolum]|uniref:Alpha/beta hydrolase family protein n=1 Tax=Pelagibacterium luteolum TaxID=440168 RepID=A0A1G7VC02_9HYPH|nr:alpha/beta hydrolase [Pelagibacterium luteolum]SDG57274.1 Alpha/beta hydrolase family protein [Pelagibacterium luteolum]